MSHETTKMFLNVTKSCLIVRVENLNETVRSREKKTDSDKENQTCTPPPLPLKKKLNGCSLNRFILFNLKVGNISNRGNISEYLIQL